MNLPVQNSWSYLRPLVSTVGVDLEDIITECGYIAEIP